MKREEIGLIGGGIAFAALLAAVIAAAAGTLHPVSLPQDKPGEGVGRYADAEIYRGGVYSAPAEIEEDWFRPEEAPVVWTAVRDIGCPDWDVDSTLWGWDGHHMEVWEMDLYARIVYLEFWGTSPECTEAGADSILRLWELGEYGDTIGELLMAQYAPGYYVYSPYAYVWDWMYDAEGLADIRALCEERFRDGPVWCAPYFRLWYYHEWAVPAYQIDGVYFSVPRG